MAQSEEQQSLLEENRSKYNEEDNFFGFTADLDAEYDGIPKARDEDYCRSICLCFCPRIGWLQFITIVTLVELVVFIITCSVYGLDDHSFLGPNMKALAWGWSDVRKIREDY